MNILFLGAPGSGKGTQSKNIEKKFNIPQISTGDLLRAETASGSKMGQELKDIMSSGKFVSDDVVLKLVSKKITSNDCKNGLKKVYFVMLHRLTKFVPRQGIIPSPKY